MISNPNSLLPAYRRIEQELKEYIRRNKLKPHDRLPTESQLVAEYAASIGTVRKAMDQLEHAQVIYRRHGQGTFVAPRARKSRILLVPNEPTAMQRPDSDAFRFFMGALTESHAAELDCEPQLVERTEFFRSIKDFRLVYPDTPGVIFFRAGNGLAAVEQELHALGIRTFFYGAPQAAEAPLRFSCTLCQNEAEIAELLAAYLERRGYRTVAGFAGDFDICRDRSVFFAEAAGRHGLNYTAFDGKILDDFDFLAETARKFDVITPFVDICALEAMQLLFYRRGIRTPEDVAIFGIDNLAASQSVLPGLTTVDLCNFENGKLAIRRFTEFLENGGKVPFHLFGESRLVPRASC